MAYLHCFVPSSHFKTCIFQGQKTYAARCFQDDEYKTYSLTSKPDEGFHRVGQLASPNIHLC